MRNRPCPVTSRTNPYASIQTRLRCTAARLLPVSCSVMGAYTRGHLVSTRQRAGGWRESPAAQHRASLPPPLPARKDEASAPQARGQRCDRLQVEGQVWLNGCQRGEAPERPRGRERPCLRRRSATETPASCFFRMPMIWSLVNLLRFISGPRGCARVYLKLDEAEGATSSPAAPFARSFLCRCDDLRPLSPEHRLNGGDTVDHFRLPESTAIRLPFRKNGG